MLAESAFLLALVPKKLGDGKPFDRLFVIALVRGHHARECGSHFRTERDGAIAFIREIVELRDDLFPALGREEIERFEGRAIILAKAIGSRHRAPLLEEVIASISAPDILSRQRIWIKIAKAG